MKLIFFYFSKLYFKCNCFLAKIQGDKHTVNKIYCKVLPEIRLYEAQILNESIINKINESKNKFSLTFLIYILPKKFRKEVKDSYLETKSDIIDIRKEMELENQYSTYIKLIIIINIISVIINFIYYKIKDITIPKAIK